MNQPFYQIFLCENRQLQGSLSGAFHTLDLTGEGEVRDLTGVGPCCLGENPGWPNIHLGFPKIEAPSRNINTGLWSQLRTKHTEKKKTLPSWFHSFWIFVIFHRWGNSWNILEAPVTSSFSWETPRCLFFDINWSSCSLPVLQPSKLMMCLLHLLWSYRI